MEHVSDTANGHAAVSRRTKTPTASSALARIGALALILIITSFLGYKLGWFDYTHMLQHVARLRRSHGFAAFTIGFVLIFGIGTALGVPGLPMTVAAGLLFGTLLGTVLSWVGGMVGATAGYWLSRTIGRGVVTRWLRRFKRMDAAVADSRDFPAMLRLRLIPVFPLAVINFVGGIARAPFGPYLAATALGILPAFILYAYFADTLYEQMRNGGSAWLSLVIASILIIAFTVAPRLVKRR